MAVFHEHSTSAAQLRHASLFHTGSRVSTSSLYLYQQQLTTLPHNRYTHLAAGAAAPSLSHQEQRHLTLPSCSTAHHTLTPQHAHLHCGPEALPLTHHNHIYSRHPTAFSCSSSVPCHNHTLLKGRICPPLLKIPPILPRTAHLPHIFASLNARKRLSTPQVPPVHRLGIPHELRPLAWWQNPLEAHCIHVCTKFPPLSTRNGSLQLFDRVSTLSLY